MESYEKTRRVIENCITYPQLKVAINYYNLASDMFSGINQMKLKGLIEKKKNELWKKE